MPDDIPPAFQDRVGRIQYAVEAWLDKTEGTPCTYTLGPTMNLHLLVAIPLEIRSNQSSNMPSEVSVTKHNLSVTCVLDKPLYPIPSNVEDRIEITAELEVKNLGSADIAKVLYAIRESNHYTSNHAVIAETVKLSKGLVPNCKIKSHSIFRKKIKLRLPRGYDKPTILKTMGPKRISVEHSIFFNITKDTALGHGVRNISP